MTNLQSITVAISAWVLGALSTATASDEWPRFRGPTGEGTWNPAGIPSDLSSITPRQLWKQKLGGGYGGVTVSGGKVYVMDRQTKPEEMERVLCLDQATGDVLWQHSWPVAYGSLEYGNGPRASVTIHEGKAYTLGALGTALCLDAATGKVSWQADMVKEHGAVVPQWGFAASPYIWKDTVLLHVGAEPGGSIVALDMSNGGMRWRGGSDPAGYATPVVFETPAGKELIQWGPEHVESLSPEDGSSRWRFPYKITYGVSIAQPIYHEGILLVSGYWHGTRALKPGAPSGSPQLVWSDEKVLCGLMSQPLYKDGFVYLLTKADGVVCFRMNDGSIRWKNTGLLTTKDRNPQVSLVWAHEPQGIACALNALGELIFVRFTPEKMEELSRHQIVGRTWAHPAFTRNQIFARSDSEIIAWELWP
jgi:outer membrane protein assembly factor BamB